MELYRKGGTREREPPIFQTGSRRTTSQYPPIATINAEETGKILVGKEGLSRSFQRRGTAIRAMAICPTSTPRLKDTSGMKAPALDDPTPSALNWEAPTVTGTSDCKGDGRYPKLLANLAKVDVLILDD